MAVGLPILGSSVAIACIAVFPAFYLSALAKVVSGWGSAIPPAIALKALGAPFFLNGHMVLCSAKGLSNLSGGDWFYIVGIVQLSLALAGPTGVLGFTPPAFVLSSAAIFMGVSFALVAASRKVPFWIPLMAFVASALLAYIGALPYLLERGLVPPAWKPWTQVVSMCVSCLYATSNLALLVWLPPSLLAVVGQGCKVLASTLLLSGNAVAMKWHEGGAEWYLEGMGSSKYIKAIKETELGVGSFAALVAVFYVSAQVAQHRLGGGLERPKSKKVYVSPKEAAKKKKAN